MKTEHRFAEALKNMMSETSLDNISVISLCKKCKVNRQTFYYHFHDIYDLLTLVYLDEHIDGLNNVKNINEMMRTIFDYTIRNLKFVEATLNSAGRDLFEQFIYNSTFLTLYRLINETPDSKKIHANDRKAIARFYALGYSHSFVYYFTTHKTKNYENMMSTFFFLGDDILQNAIRRIIEIKGKEKA